MLPTAIPDAPASLKDHFRNLPQYLLPHRLLTRLTYRLTRARTPWLKDRLIDWFVQHYQVKLTEALEPNWRAYPDFNAFFTRALKPGTRPITPGDRVVCCPVDGTISQVGKANADTLLQAKGRNFSLTALLGGDPEWAKLFQGGSFATVYLSPSDYHRIHIPLAGRLREMVHIPGRLFSVSPLTTRVVPELFARNERVAMWFDTPAGPMALVLVGAINVASIETVWAGAITPPLGTSVSRWTYPATGKDVVRLDKGAELGRFNMGSTVIVLFGPNTVRWGAELRHGSAVKIGQRLGKVTKQG